jgi:hypothetical protein
MKMAAIPITITDAKVDETNATITGNLSLTGLSVGGGPVYPPETGPTPPGGPPHPVFPIWGPPGMELPDVPGYPPTVGGGPIMPPTAPIPPKPPVWIPVFVPGYGWIAVPGFPHPTPSKK